MLFVNQHLKLRNIEVKPDKQILNISGFAEQNIRTELNDMYKHFFNSSVNL